MKSLLLVFLLVFPAYATTRYVDGACSTSGNGSTLTCGASGPFRTISEGINITQPNDVLDVRGGHGTFDGVYFEQLRLRTACAPGRCTIENCQSPSCANDQPVRVRGMTLRSDWSGGPDIWHRTMEIGPDSAGVDSPTQNRDIYDPQQLMWGLYDPKTMMGYAGDNVVFPIAGQWSYNPTYHIVYVHPPLGDDPRQTVFVPYYSHAVWLQPPASNWTIQGINVEGTRVTGIFNDGGGGHPVSGTIISHVTIWYTHRFAILAEAPSPGIQILDTLMEHIARGGSWFRDTGDGGYGARVFQADGGKILRSRCDHISSRGQWRYSCGCINSWSCTGCDPPWDNPAYNYSSSGGTCYDIKQTIGFEIGNSFAGHGPNRGIHIDCSRNVSVHDNQVDGASLGISSSDQTPTGGCPSTDPSHRCFNGNVTIANNTISNTWSFWTRPGCALNVDENPLHTDSQFLAHVSSTRIIPPYQQTTCVPPASSVFSIMGTAIGGTTTTIGVTTSTSRPPTTVTTAPTTSIPSTSSTSTSTSSTLRTTTTLACIQPHMLCNTDTDCCQPFPYCRRWESSKTFKTCRDSAPPQ